MILIVDDYPDTCRLLMKLLQRIGHRVECVHDGRDALEVVRAVRPACIILDVMMPEMDGFEVLKRLRAGPATADVPVMMYSASASEADRHRAEMLGADDFASKVATDWTELLAKVQRLVEGRQPQMSGVVPEPGLP
jgi:CheY-like chemotaxis protein